MYTTNIGTLFHIWNTHMNQSHLSNSLSLGLSILENAARRKDSFSLSEMAKILGAPKTTAFRLLKTLSELNYLKYDISTKRYSLGTQFLLLGVSSFQRMEIREVSKLYLEELSRKWDKSINILVFDKTEMIYIERTKVSNVRELNINIGTRVPVYSTAAGMAVLAYLDRTELIKVINVLKSYPDSFREIGGDGTKLVASLKEVKANGFAAIDKEQEKGIRAVAAPIFSHSGERYAINVAVASDIVSMTVLKKEYAPALMRVASQISNALGYSTSPGYLKE